MKQEGMQDKRFAPCIWQGDGDALKRRSRSIITAAAVVLIVFVALTVRLQTLTTFFTKCISFLLCVRQTLAGFLSIPQTGVGIVKTFIISIGGNVGCKDILVCY